jgi:hypothetical protein
MKVAVGLPDRDHMEHDRPPRGEHEGLQLDQEARHHHAAGTVGWRVRCFRIRKFASKKTVVVKILLARCSISHNTRISYNGSLVLHVIAGGITMWSDPLFGHRPFQPPGNVTRH